MLGSILKLGQLCLDTLYPPHCLHCKDSNSWFCENCINQIDFITTTNICLQCGTPIVNKLSACKQCQNNPLHYLDGIRVMAFFEDNPIRTAIHEFKYNNHKAVAPILGRLLVNSIEQYKLNADIIVPVPLHPTRFRERGYNQSELLAKNVAQLLNMPLNNSGLKRARKTESQMTLTATERRKNVSGAFHCSPQQFSKQKLLLIDDVYTTGSTLDACAAALKRGGAATVMGLTLAMPRPAG